MKQRRRLHLLPPPDLVRTGPVDHADWNYGRLISPLQRRRFYLVNSLFAGRRFSRLLEIGYGSGIFMPHLATVADHLSGIDVHDRAIAVAEVLDRFGVSAHLSHGSAEALPYESGSMDAIVAVSAISFIDDIDAAAIEFARVLRPAGSLFVVMPHQSRALDLALELFTGESAKTDYGDRRSRVLPALARQFDTVRRSGFPMSVGPVRVYTALELRPRA